MSSIASLLIAVNVVPSSWALAYSSVVGVPPHPRILKKREWEIRHLNALSSLLAVATVDSPAIN